MFDVKYLLFSLWEWIIQHGLPLSALMIIAILIPRIGRQAVRVLTDRMEHGQEETKAKLALVGALVYVLEIVAYFILVLVALTNLGVPAMGAAIPATVVSAAIGFGSQNIIGDFLTGFFIISERHYGVGDVVTFDDTSGQITGTVVKLTLRSTQIRTAAGELVTVPNSKASVTINYSQKWSRAVVDLDIPMTDNESMADLLSLVERASKEAIEAAGVGDSIRGEIEVQPALSITPPAAAGLPWSVGMGVNVDTSPATQWAVERAIRANLVNTFWDRYQAPGEALTAHTELGAPAGTSPQAVGRHTEAAADPGRTSDSDEDDRADQSSRGDRGDTDRVIAAATAGSDHMSIDDADAEDATEVIDWDGAAAVPDPDDPVTEVLPSSEAEPATDGRDGDGGKEKSDLADLVEGPYESKTKNLLSFGGRFRPSTAGLFIALVIVGMLALFSSNPDDAEPGILSPDRWRNAGTEVESTETDTTGTSETAENTPDVTDDTETGDTGDTDTTGTDDSGTTGGTGTNGTGNSGGSGNTGNSGNTGETGGEGTDNSGSSQQNQGQGLTQQDDSTGTNSGGESAAP